MPMLSEKVAIVTGANMGIGRAIADRFAAEGALVVIAARTQELIDKTVAEILAAGGKAVGHATDVSNPDQIRALMETVHADHGRIDILVNNAGITRYRPFSTMTPDDWDIVLNVDLKGVFFCCQAVAPYMRKQGYGKIVNISSAAGTGSTPGKAAGSPGATAPYASAKAAVNQLTKTLARELGPDGITVNCVAAGTFPTALSSSTRTPEELEAHLAARGKSCVLGRVGRVEECASAALFFSSDDSSYVTGQTLNVDGGRTDKI